MRREGGREEPLPPPEGGRRGAEEGSALDVDAARTLLRTAGASAARLRRAVESDMRRGGVVEGNEARDAAGAAEDAASAAMGRAHVTSACWRRLRAAAGGGAVACPARPRPLASCLPHQLPPPSSRSLRLFSSRCVASHSTSRRARQTRSIPLVACTSAARQRGEASAYVGDVGRGKQQHPSAARRVGPPASPASRQPARGS